jgi:hypothetical protein
VKGTNTKKEGKELKNQGTTGSMIEEISEYLGREGAREKNNGEIQMWKRGERKQVLSGSRGKKVQNVLRGERDNRAHLKWM